MRVADFKIDDALFRLLRCDHVDPGTQTPHAPKRSLALLCLSNELFVYSKLEVPHFCYLYMMLPLA